jgi:putative oxidoreductase
MQFICSLIVMFGRICLSIIFILSGIGKFVSYSMTAAYMATKGMTMIPFFLYSAALIEIIFGLGILLGFKARWAAGVLALYLIPVTLIFHDFWNVSWDEQHLQMIMFCKNLAIFGGLWIVVGSGSGKCSFDASCCKKDPVVKT